MNKFIIFCGQKSCSKGNKFYLFLFEEKKGKRITKKKIMSYFFPLFIEEIRKECQDMAHIVKKEGFSIHNGWKEGESRKKLKRNYQLEQTDYKTVKDEISFIKKIYEAESKPPQRKPIQKNRTIF